MSKKINQAHIAPLAFLFITPFFCVNAMAEQNTTDEWKEQKRHLAIWVASIKSVKCNFSLSKFTNSKFRKARQAAWQTTVSTDPKGQPPLPDSNSSFSYFWLADLNRWRCDKSRFYPKTGFDFSQYIFDGEKYYFFDEELERAVIDAQDTQHDFIKSLNSNVWLGLNAIAMLDSYTTAGLGGLKKTGEEILDGRKCSVFKASNGKGELTVHIDNENHLLARIKEIFRSNPDYTSIIIYRWSDIKQVNGIPVPFACKLETYDVEKGKPSWGQSVLFKMQSCEVNVSLSRGFFENILRVGTPLEDNIENPGILSYIGGSLSVEAEKVRIGLPPG